MYQNKNQRQLSLFRLIKIAAKKSEDLDALREIFSSKYPGERAVSGFAIQYYNKFIRTSDPSVTLTEENLPERLPETIEELKALIQSFDTVKAKTKKEEFVENLKSKYPNVDFTNLNEDYLSWLHQRYIENKTKSGEIVHPIEEALETLKKFPSIQTKYKVSPELKNKIYNAGYEDISYIGNLTLDDMESIIILDTSDLTVRVEGVEIKDREFLGKFGEWNLWLPHTKETSVKIAGYDEKYNPKTTWCTARTRGSNLFYNYIGRKDIPTFLFYIIKDNPNEDEDWLSLGYVSQGNRLSPDFSGRGGGLSVNRANNGLKEGDFSRILGDAWSSIKLRIETELEKHKIVEVGKQRYISPARFIVESLAKNVEEFKKELDPKSNEEKKDFIKVIINSEPSEEVLSVCGKTLARIDSGSFIYDFPDKPWAQPYLDLAAKNLAEKKPVDFFYQISDKPWAQLYIDLAAKNLAYKNSEYLLKHFSDKPWAQHHIDLAAKNLIEKDPERFIYHFSDKPWAQRHIDLAVKNIIEKDPYGFLDYFPEKPWAKSYVDLVAKILIEDDPDGFLEYYLDKPWAQPYIPLAESKLKNKQASSKITNKLMKLSKLLRSNNHDEHKKINYFLKYNKFI